MSLNTAAEISQGGESGLVVVAASLGDSLLWQRIASGEMPPDRKLSSVELSILRNWITNGARGLPPRGEAQLDAARHWAFRSLRLPPLPTVRDASRVRTAIDRFIQAELERNNLTLGPEADRTTLIRRFSFDLIGLPPTPEEVISYLSDASPEAYEQRIAQLLDSSRYGEHWGKHWLDIAGYAESNGYSDADSERPLAYRYRDYVIRAFNRDLPFTEFLREQLTGDELAFELLGGEIPTGPVDAKVVELLEATHFLRNQQDGTGESDGNPEEVRADRRAVLEGGVELWGSALFGLTLKCARCHDHKFEPLKQADYYRLCAVLAPVYDEETWKPPNERLTYAVTAAELSAFQAAVREGTKSELNRPGKLAWSTDLTTQPGDVRLLLRGNAAQPGPVVEPGVIEVLVDTARPFEIRPPEHGLTTGRRTGFANWLLDPESRAAALVARVHVNRVWQRYFGTGLVATTDNLGVSGAPPSHPELLEWLAAEFVRSGWSQKALHRLIVSSHVYRQSSEARPDGTAIDPASRLLWRMPLRRLTAEQIRDAILACSGEIDFKMGGPSIATGRTGVGEVVVDQYGAARGRRTVYVEQRRTQIATILRVFDAPTIVSNCVERQSSVGPLQPLTMLNSTFVRGCAVRMAKRVSLESRLESDNRISHAFLLTFGREPDAGEMRAALQFLRAQTGLYHNSPESPQRQAWADFCHSLLASNAFLYLE